MEKKQEKIDAKYVGSELDGLRKKILDFSRRNRLLNFKHARGQDYIRVVDEIPQLYLINSRSRYVFQSTS